MSLSQSSGHHANLLERTNAVQNISVQKGFKVSEYIKDFEHFAQEQWVPENGARVIAKACNKSRI